MIEALMKEDDFHPMGTTSSPEQTVRQSPSIRASTADGRIYGTGIRKARAERRFDPGGAVLDFSNIFWPKRPESTKANYPCP